MLEFQLSKLRLGVDYVKQFEQVLLNSTRRHLRDLYSRLIGPVAELLKSSSLVIVPYGPLHSLPFHALFDGENYVVDRFTVSYSPSASVFCRSRYRGLGNPEDISLILGIEDSRMPAIKEEIDAVAAMLPNARVFWAGDATESALREYGPSSRVIHIATHGYFRSDNPMFSAIRLADSYLTLHDLYGMNLPAEFMTLSGCVTGLGVIEAGDELIGLARGLLYAGARCLLLTLWEVDDQSTAHFMRILYGHSENGFSRAAAVRSAMLQLRERYPHPYYWAPFKLIGRSFDGPQSVN
jgi:CHAT domain-containing protein